MFCAHEVFNFLRASNFRTPTRPAGFENFRLWSIGGSDGSLRHVRSRPDAHRIWLGAYESTFLAKPRPRALPRLLGLDLAVARRRIGLQRGQQTPRAVGDFGNRAVERLGIGLRGRIEAGELAHELQRGRMDLG